MRVIHLDSSLEWRGGQVQLLHLLRETSGALVASPRSPLFIRAKQSGVEVQAHAFGGLLSTARLPPLLRRLGADLVAAHTSRAHTDSWVARIRPLVVHRRVDFHPRTLSRWKYHYPIGYIAVSHAVAGVLVESGVPPARVAIVPDGVAPDPAPEVACKWIRAELGLSPEDVLILAVGALVPHKGHRYLIEGISVLLQQYSALKKVMRLVILGEGAERKALVAQIRRLGLEGVVSLPGFQLSVGDWYAAADLFVHPSVEEGLGQAVIEAMLAGVPVVATRAGGIVDLLDERLAWLVVPRSGPALAAAIHRALSSGDERFIRRAAAKHRAEDFSVRQMVEGTLQAYDRWVP